MRAMVLEKAGGPLLLRDVQKPVAGPGQVRARVVSNALPCPLGLCALSRGGPRPCHDQHKSRDGFEIIQP